MERLAYSVTQVKEQIPLSRTKIYELIAAGQLKTFRVGGRVFITHDELERFISSCVESKV